MNLEIETKIPNKKSESADFYIDFSLKLMNALKEKAQEHNKSSDRKISVSQVIEKYCGAAANYIKDESIDINTYSMAKVNSFLNGSKVEISVEKAKEELKKSGLEFDFGNLNNLYIASPKDKCNKWYKI